MPTFPMNGPFQGGGQLNPGGGELLGGAASLFGSIVLSGTQTDEESCPCAMSGKASLGVAGRLIAAGQEGLSLNLALAAGSRCLGDSPVAMFVSGGVHSHGSLLARGGSGSSLSALLSVTGRRYERGGSALSLSASLVIGGSFYQSGPGDVKLDRLRLALLLTDSLAV